MSLLSLLKTRSAMGRCDRVGARPRLDGAPFVINRGRIEIGDDFSLASRPVQSHLVTEPGGVLEIGHRVSIAHGLALSAHQQIRIGDGSRIGAMVVIADTDFHVAGDRSAEAPTSPVIIGKNVRIGSRVTLLRGSVIGDGAQIDPGSVVNGAIAAGARVAGVPARPIDSSPRDGEDAQATDVAVRRLVARVLGLSQVPALEQGPPELVGWDSLGALKLLLALEEEFGLTLREEDLGRARKVSDLLRAVESAQSP